MFRRSNTAAAKEVKDYDVTDTRRRSGWPVASIWFSIGGLTWLKNQDVFTVNAWRQYGEFPRFRWDGERVLNSAVIFNCNSGSSHRQSKVASLPRGKKALRARL